MQANKALYEGFLDEGQTIDEYVKYKIDLPSVEIEHQGIDALYDTLLGPAGISLEITYLTERNDNILKPIEWKPKGSLDDDQLSWLTSATIRLLYSLPYGTDRSQSVKPHS